MSGLDTQTNGELRSLSRRDTHTAVFLRADLKRNQGDFLSSATQAAVDLDVCRHNGIYRFDDEVRGTLAVWK